MNIKRDVPMEHWDRLFAPSSCLVMITTVNCEGQINAAHSAPAPGFATIRFISPSRWAPARTPIETF